MSLKYGPYSHSRLESSKCPYRFLHEYILQDIDKRSSAAARKGQAAHLAFEHIVNKKISHDTAPIDPTQLADWACKQALVDDPELYRIVQASVRLFLEGWEQFPVLLDKVVGVEELLAVDAAGQACDYDAPEAYMRGKADVLMIDGAVATIIDHKMQLNYETSDTFQMAIYAALVFMIYPYVEEVRTILHFAAPEMAFCGRAYRWTREAALQQYSIAQHLISLAEMGTGVEKKTLAEPGYYCQYCSVLHLCPEKARIEKSVVQKPGPIADTKTAMEYAKSYVFLKEYVSAVESHLKDYLRNVSRIPVGSSSVVEMRASMSRAYDRRDDILAALEKHGLTPMDYLTISGTTIGKLINKCPNPQLLSELESLTYKKPTVKMGVYKA